MGRYPNGPIWLATSATFRRDCSGVPAGITARFIVSRNSSFDFGLVYASETRPHFLSTRGTLGGWKSVGTSGGKLPSLSCHEKLVELTADTRDGKVRRDLPPPLPPPLPLTSEKRKSVPSIRPFPHLQTLPCCPPRLQLRVVTRNEDGSQIDAAQQDLQLDARMPMRMAFGGFNGTHWRFYGIHMLWGGGGPGAPSDNPDSQ